MPKNPENTQNQSHDSPHPRRHSNKHDKYATEGDRRESSATQSSTQSREQDNDVYFIIPRTVTVVYGPYMFQGMMDYRTERLQGIKMILEKMGVTVQLTPCLDHANLCRVWFLDEIIFSCKMTDLMYGGDGELDSLCLEAAESLEKFIKNVLKSLKKQKSEVTPQQLKDPFCPCFQIDHTGHQHEQQQRLSLGSTISGNSGYTGSSRQGTGRTESDVEEIFD